MIDIGCTIIFDFMKIRHAALLVAAWMIATASSSVALPAGWRAATLTPDQPEFDWNGWHIKIGKIYMTATEPREFGQVDQEQEQSHSHEESVFIAVSMTVKNSSRDGQPFIPQNTLKIELGGNHFDAQDLQGLDDLGNIEPTLTKTRQCYFEVPKDLLNDSFVISFSEFLAQQKLLTVALNMPELTPTPAPTPVRQAEVQQTPTAISGKKDISEETLTRLFGSPYVKVERKGPEISSITFSKFEDHSFHGGECYTLILEVLRGSDGSELGGESIPGVTIKEDRSNSIGMPIWEDSQTGCAIEWTGDFRFTVTRNGQSILTAHLTSDADATRFVLVPVVRLPLQAKAQETVNDKRDREPTPAATPVMSSADQILATLSDAFDHYDWPTVLQYTADGQISYYGHYNVSNEFIKRDIINDSHTYRSSHTTIDWSTLRTLTVGRLTYASVTEWTAVYERSGRYHHAHAVWTVGFDPQDSKVYLLDFKVIR